jgi:Carboxylesterase family
MIFLAWVAVVAVWAKSSHAQNPQVTLPGLGTMEGYVGASYINEKPFFHFRGVPFAQPPVDALRFKVKII